MHPLRCPPRTVPFVTCPCAVCAAAINDTFALSLIKLLVSFATLIAPLSVVSLRPTPSSASFSGDIVDAVVQLPVLPTKLPK
ncbi:MAG: hypothetical protein ACJ70S_06990 [Nitrososphaera sp.]